MRSVFGLFVIAFVLLSVYCAESSCSNQVTSASDGFCTYDRNSCCQIQRGNKCLSELSKTDRGSPKVTFKNDSVFLDLHSNRICLRGLERKAVKGENWHSLRGVNIQITVEMNALELGANMVEVMFDERLRKTGRPDLERLFICFSLSANTPLSLSELRKDGSVFVWLSIITLPPSVYSKPVEYPRPVQLSSADIVELEVPQGSCLVHSIRFIKNFSLPTNDPPHKPTDPHLKCYIVVSLLVVLLIGSIAALGVLIVQKIRRKDKNAPDCLDEPTDNTKGDDLMDLERTAANAETNDDQDPMGVKEAAKNKRTGDDQYVIMNTTHSSRRIKSTDV